MNTNQNNPVSISKELRKRFAQPEKSISEEVVAPIVAEALAIAKGDLEDVVVADIKAMIQKGYRSPLEGYILCLSRIIDHKKGWEYLSRAFQECNEKVPERYHKQFGQHLSSVPPQKGSIVQ